MRFGHSFGTVKKQRLYGSDGPYVHYCNMFTYRVQYIIVNRSRFSPMPTNEHRILDAALKALKRTTGLDAQIHAATAGQDRATDAIIELTTNQRKHRFRAAV